MFPVTIWLLAAVLLVAAFDVAILLATGQRSLRATLLSAAAVASSTAVGVSFAPSEQVGYAVVRTTSGVLVLGLLACCAKPMIKTLGTEFWLLALTAWALVSIAWTDSLVDGAKSFGGFVAAILLGAFLATRERVSVVSMLAYTLTALAVASYVVVLFLPTVGILEAVRAGSGLSEVEVGLFPWNSEFGMVSGMASIFTASVAMDTRRWRFVIMSGVTFSVTLTTDSATSLLATVAGMTVLTVWRIQRLRFAVGLATVTIVLMGLFGFLDDLTRAVLSELGRSPDLTGRTVIWGYVWQAAQETLLIGHGIGTEPDLQSALGFTGHAHNGYLELVFGLGLIGAAIFLVGFVRCLGRATNNPLQLAIVAAFAVSNLANNYLLTSSFMFAMYAWIALQTASPVASTQSAPPELQQQPARHGAKLPAY